MIFVFIALVGGAYFGKYMIVDGAFGMISKLTPNFWLAHTFFDIQKGSNYLEIWDNYLIIFLMSIFLILVSIYKYRQIEKSGV